MKVLFFVPYTPTPIRTRPSNLLRGLAARGHQVTLVTPWEGEEERESLAGWEQHGVQVVSAQLTKAQVVRNLATALPSRAPLQAAYAWHPGLARQAQALLHLHLRPQESPFDVVHVEHLRGARMGLSLKEQADCPVVWDSVDCISYLFEQAARGSTSMVSRLKSRIDLPRTRRYEGWLVSRFDQVLVTSPVDRDALQSLAGTKRAPIDVVPNGVDLEYFSPTTDLRDEALVFSGKMSYHANVAAVLHFVRDILPRVWLQRPQVRFVIAGYCPPKEIRELSRDPRITVTGSVPDLRPHLRGAAIAVAPMAYGAGIQNKVLEAMACGTPVVATPQAVAALEARPGRDLLVAETAETFAQAVLGLLANGRERTEIGAAGRRYVEEHDRWSRRIGQLEGIYQAVIEKRTHSQGQEDGRC